MPRKIVIEKRNKGCIAWSFEIIVALIVFWALVAMLSVVGCVIAVIGLWFLIRHIWRALVREKPESSFVQWGLRLAPVTRKLIAGIVSVLLIVFLVGILAGFSGSNESSTPDNRDGQTTQEQVQPNSNESSRNNSESAQNGAPEASSSDENSEETASLFEADAEINELLNSYNSANSKDEINAGDFEVYRHHGSSHKDQAIDYDHNGYEVVITDLANMEVVIQSQNSKAAKASSAKTECIRWIRALYPGASETAIGDVWKEMKKDLTHSVTVENDTFGNGGIEISVDYGLSEIDGNASKIELITLARN